MHLEFKATLVTLLTKKHFESSAGIHTEDLFEILSEASEQTNTYAIMHKKKIYYPEMLTDTEEAHMYSREISAAPLHIIPKLDEFDEDIKQFQTNRKKFYAFMRKIVNTSKTIHDIRALMPESYQDSITTTQNFFEDSSDYPTLSKKAVADFKEQNDASYKFLNEQNIWDSMGI